MLKRVLILKSISQRFSTVLEPHPKGVESSEEYRDNPYEDA